MSNIVTICLEPKSLKKVDDFAKENEMSRSQAIRYAILRQLKETRREKKKETENSQR